MTVTVIHSRPIYDILSALITVFRISGCETGCHVIYWIFNRDQPLFKAEHIVIVPFGENFLW